MPLIGSVVPALCQRFPVSFTTTDLSKESTMTSFSIDTYGVLTVAASLENEEQDIVQYIKQTTLIAEEIASTWKGDAAMAFQQAKEIWDEGIMKMDLGMRNACAVLRNNVSSYQSADQDLQSLFRGFAG